MYCRLMKPRLNQQQENLVNGPPGTWNRDLIGGKCARKKRLGGHGCEGQARFYARHVESGETLGWHVAQKRRVVDLLELYFCLWSNKLVKRANNSCGVIWTFYYQTNPWDPASFSITYPLWTTSPNCVETAKAWKRISVIRRLKYQAHHFQRAEGLWRRARAFRKVDRRPVNIFWEHAVEENKRHQETSDVWKLRGLLLRSSQV